MCVCVCTISQGFTEPENGQWLCSFTYIVIILSDDNIITSTVHTIGQVWRWCHRGDCMGKKIVCVCVCTRTYVCMYVIIMKMYITGYGMKLQSFFITI